MSSKHPQMPLLSVIKPLQDVSFRDSISRIVSDDNNVLTVSDVENNVSGRDGKSNDPIAVKFNTFFQERESEKKRLYSKVIMFGWFIFAIGIIIGSTGITMWYAFETGTVISIIGSIGATVGTFMFSLGVSIVSTVPTDEFDADKYLFSRPKQLPYFKLFFEVMMITCGIIFGTFSPYFPGGLIILCGLWMFVPIKDSKEKVLTPSTPENASISRISTTSASTTNDEANFISTSSSIGRLYTSLQKFSFCTRVSTGGVMMFMPISCCYMTLGIDPLYLSKSNIIFPGIWLEWTSFLHRKSHVSSPTFVITGLIFILCMIISMCQWYKLSQKKDKGWKTAVVYNIFYCWFLSVSINLLIVNIVGVIYGFVPDDPNVLYPDIAVVTLVVIPILIILVYGRENCFTFIARRFEYDVDRQQRDGAHLAALAASSHQSNSGDDSAQIYWVHRKEQHANLQKIMENLKGLIEKNGDTFNYIDRSLWVKGSIRSLSSLYDGDEGNSKSCRRVITIDVDIKEDQKFDWYCKFEGARYIMNNVDLQDQNFVSGNDSFEQWHQSTFPGTTKSDNSSLAGDYVFSFTREEVVNVSTEDDLLKWAQKNLRVFHWKNFKDDLLLRSPRELTTEQDKDETFALSSEIKVLSENDKIDYFISHSWSDKPAVKIEKLRKFAEDFNNRHKRYPTFWLDKVCINQKNPGDSLAVLPINIGACKKLLIVLSNSYVTRLWCIWELITLFTFCNKELAIKRIDFIFLDSDGTKEDCLRIIKKIASFNINNAHCYDPNEEFKLRLILQNIGLERLQTILKDISNNLLKLYDK